MFIHFPFTDLFDQSRDFLLEAAGRFFSFFSVAIGAIEAHHDVPPAGPGVLLNAHRTGPAQPCFTPGKEFGWCLGQTQLEVM